MTLLCFSNLVVLIVTILIKHRDLRGGGIVGFFISTDVAGSLPLSLVYYRRTVILPVHEQHLHLHMSKSVGSSVCNVVSDSQLHYYTCGQT